MSEKLTDSASTNYLQPLALALSVILLLSILGLILPNWQNTSLNAFANTIEVPLAALNLACLLVGCLAGASFSFALRKKERNVEVTREWQVQDAKLAASIVSDKEKQLEAKIATLEAALRTALKKNV